MAVKMCWIFLILIGLLHGSALAGSSFQPTNALNNIESNNSLVNSSITNNESVRAEMLKLPLSFIENQGQFSSDVKFMVKTSLETIYFTPSDVLFALSSKNDTSIIRMSFVGAGPRKLVGEGLLPGTANFFIGSNSSKWITDISTYDSVKYESLYPGVDLVFKGTEGNLKHELLLRPGADPDEIILAYNGQDNLSLDKDGSILIKAAAGILTDSAPFCYQEVNGTRVIVEGKYRRIDDRRIGFEIENYNTSLPLVIDPLLRYSTYLGGRNADQGTGIAVDGRGNVYVTGWTNSINFPTENAYHAANAGEFDAFVTELSSAGNKLIYSTYLGGKKDDVSNGIAVDGRGNAYVTGFTSSTDFPTENAYQPANAGGCDAFVAKLNSAGNRLVYSTYLGGSVDDKGNGIAVDSSGNAYITGSTSSTGFPIKNPYQAANAGISDAFVTKLNSAGNRLAYSTYLGGSSSDLGNGIAIDYSGNAYVIGKTNSTNFPTENAYQPANAGAYDAFIAKLNSEGNKLAYSTYLGGSSVDVGYSIAVDYIHNAYVTGFTSSADFPTKDPYQAKKSGCTDAFVSKLSPAGNKLIYSTYLGGNSCDVGYGIALDIIGNAYVAGIAPSKDFSIKNPYQAANAGGSDVFVAKLSSIKNRLVYSTYLGGSDEDWGKSIAVDRSCEAYVAGWTNSTNFPTKKAYQAANAGENDALIAVFKKTLLIAPSKPSGPLSVK